jgi:hypothetical protein
VAVLEPPPAPESAPDPDPADPDIVDDVAPEPDGPFPVDDVVALAGFLPAAAVDGSAARAGEIATSPTTPAASGNRNRRCMAAS